MIQKLFSMKKSKLFQKDFWSLDLIIWMAPFNVIGPRLWEVVLKLQLACGQFMALAHG